MVQKLPGRQNATYEHHLDFKTVKLTKQIETMDVIMRGVSPGFELESVMFRCSLLLTNRTMPVTVMYADDSNNLFLK